MIVHVVLNVHQKMFVLSEMSLLIVLNLYCRCLNLLLAKAIEVRLRVMSCAWQVAHDYVLLGEKLRDSSFVVETSTS